MKMRKASKIALTIFLVLLAATIITPIQLEKARIAALKRNIPKLRAELKKHIPPGYEFNRKIPDTENAAIEFEQAAIIASILESGDTEIQNLPDGYSAMLEEAKRVLSHPKPLWGTQIYSELQERRWDCIANKTSMTKADVILSKEIFAQTDPIIILLAPQNA